jgi:hypothetical protein
MTSNTTLALHSPAMLGNIVRPMLVAALLIGLWNGLGRAGRNKTSRVLPWAWFALILVAWLSTVWTLSARGVFATAAASGALGAIIHVLLPIILLAFGAMILITRSRTMTAVVDAIPLWWLVSFQAYRITGFVFLRLWAKGLLPGYFALPAGIGDTLTGGLALGAAIALWQQTPWARRFAYAVNIFGLLDLASAVSMGILTAANSPTGASPLLVYPLSMVPAFGVPLAVIVHCLSIWQLRRRSQSSTGVKPAHEAQAPELGMKEARS